MCNGREQNSHLWQAAGRFARMPGRALLSGVRVVESSMLGPAEMGGLLADLGAEVIKVEPPQGDYGRQMTWPIIRSSTGEGENSKKVRFCKKCEAAID